MDEGIKITSIGGNAPVQAEGTIDGHPFYFRARWGYWSLEINTSQTGPADVLSWPEDADIWEHEEPWGDGPYAASWMPQDVVLACIEAAATSWRLQSRPS